MRANASWATPAAIFWLQDIMHDRFGKLFDLQLTRNKSLCLTIAGSSRIILFDLAADTFSRNDSDLQCAEWNAEVEGWKTPLSPTLPAPGAAILASPLIEKTPNGFHIHYDVLGLTYWMLSRQEEIERFDLDEHGRFPATSSHAFKHGYLDRPLIDEWLHILGQVIEQNWPAIRIKTHEFNIKVSHDVDGPSRYAFCSMPSLMRAMAGDALKHRNLRSAFKAPWIRIKSRAELHPSDPANTFDWIMDVSERHGLKSAFYFICGRTDRLKDADYEPEHPAIRSLMRRIHARGHEIGLHPSYGAFQQPGQIAAEAARLKKICAEEGIDQSEWGGRMHYLRLKTPSTLIEWEKAGLNYETTLGYADLPGFRCGTCFEYSAFDPVAGQKLNLRVRPLIVMECTVMAKRYLALGNGDAAFQKFTGLMDACRSVSGSFTLLWHNSQFEIKGKRDLYERILDLARVNVGDSRVAVL